MTEEEWIACKVPGQMLATLRYHRKMRKRRLFACACCRRQWQLLVDPRSRSAVEIAELFADNLVSQLKRNEAYLAALEASQCAGRACMEVAVIERTTPWKASKAAAAAVHAIAPNGTAGAAEDAASASFVDLDQWYSERSEQCRLLRDIFGNPFRPVAFAPAWRTATVASLAEAIYADRAFDRLPILADALEDAGCTSAEVLEHCRGPGPHVRGCWVVDLALGKE